MASMRAACLGAALGLLISCAAPAAHSPGTSARLLAIANTARSRGCGGRALGAPPLREQSRLDFAARQLARGASLRDATASDGYRATSSVSIRIAGDLSPDAITRTLTGRFCAQLANPSLRDVGFYRQGSDLWMLLAAPFATPALTDPTTVARRVLELTNAARATGHRCGRHAFGPAPPLHLSARLAQAAIAHSRDMAAHSYLDHTGRDGSTPADRVSRSGYAWRIVGENIAAGPTSASEVTAGWLASPEHCENIMDPRFTEMAVAYAVNPKSRAGVYWTEEFAAPRAPPRSRAR